MKENKADILLFNTLFNTLFNKIITGELTEINELLDTVWDFDMKNRDGHSLLTFLTYLHGKEQNHVTKLEYFEKIELILKKHSNPNITDINGDTSLHIAIRNKDIAVIKLLLQNDADVFAKNLCQETPIFIASQSNDKQASAKMILNVAKRFSKEFFDKSPKSIEYESVKIGLKFIAPLGDTDKYGKKLLDYAVINGWREIEDFITKNIDKLRTYINSVQPGIGTHLHTAVKLGDIGTINKLLIFGANPNLTDSNGNTPMHIAARGGDVESIMTMLSYADNINITNNAGQTPLHLAIQYEWLEATDYLLSIGADPNITDNVLNTPINLAVKSGNIQMVNLLLQYRPNLGIADSEGNPPLHNSVIKGDVNILKELLAYSNGINQINEQGKTLLILAIELHKSGLIDFLLKNGANIHIKHAKTNQPLHLAIKYFLHDTNKFVYAHIIEKLLLHGANPNLKDRNGNTALHILMQHMDLLPNTSNNAWIKKMWDDEIKSITEKLFLLVSKQEYYPNVYQKNKLKETPFSLAPNSEIRNFLLRMDNKTFGEPSPVQSKLDINILSPQGIPFSTSQFMNRVALANLVVPHKKQTHKTAAQRSRSLPAINCQNMSLKTSKNY